MSYNGSGTFQINTSGQPVVAGTVISSTAFNALTADLATGLSTAITKDGQTTATARIPFAQGISSTLTTDSSSTTTGSIITAGGVGVAKALYVGTTANVAGAATLGSTLTYGGVTLTNAVTGTGKMVLDTSPTLVTPALGTPSSGVMTNVTAVPAAQITGSRAIPKSTLPAGTILQVVQSTTASPATSNSNSYASTGFSVAITPSATSSKVLLFCNFGWSSNTADFGFFAFGVNGTVDTNTLITCLNQSAVGATNSLYFASLSYTYSPASISAQTYTLQFRCSGAPTQSLFFNDRSIGGASGLCTLTAMEIAV